MNNDEYRSELIEPLRFLPNSPTLFNIETPTGGTLSACFKFDVDDTMFDSPDGIMPVALKATKVLKAGGGVGYTFHVRPEGALVNSTHRKALGPLGVMRIYHRLALEITQGGKRDAAQMGILHCDHPDIEKFIHAKDVDPDALGTFNISVALTDEFMHEAVEVLRNPTVEYNEEQTRKARLLYDMAKSAWLTGDPGVYFIDAAERGNPTPWAGELTGTNPCGEVPLLRNEPCNLGSINLGKMLDENNDIDLNLLERTTKLAIRYLDDVLDINVFPDPEIDAAARYTRKLGLGVCGFADVLALKGIEYDSSEAIELADRIMQTIKIAASVESRTLAGIKGVAPCFEDRGWEFHFRNATRTCIAPTGTIAILMGASSGIEPYFALENTRRMGDGTILVEAPWTLEHTTFRPKVANEIDFKWHVEMQSAFQQHTDLAVSKTINMRNSATPEDILDAFIMMWETDCKGGTVYRDGSRDNQVLVAATTTNGWRDALPNERPSVTHKFEVGGVEGYLHIGLYEDGKPAEIFLDLARQGSSLSGFADWLGQTASVAFQIAHKHGIPFTVFTNKWIGRKFEPAGITLNKDIPIVESIADYLGRYLSQRFASTTPVQTPIRGDMCPDCGSILIYSEGCNHCLSCGYEKC